MKIGKIDLGERPVMLAPMEDVTDQAFRLLCKRFGADMVYSEFVSSDALIREVNRSMQKLTICDEERPVAIQIYGKDTDAMVRAAQMVEAAKPDVLDLNFGCPVKKVAGKGGGAGMLQNTPKMLEITRAVVDAVKIPVTVKTRLGWNDDSKIIVELAEQLQDCGIQALTIHGRTRAQMYTGQADWTLIGKVKENPRMHIPIIGNGDITTPERALECFDRYGVDGIMIGRGSFGRPWIFQEVKYYMQHGEPMPPLTFEWRMNVLKEETLQSVQRLGERSGIVHIRRHLAASPLFKCLPDFRSTRIAMLRVENVDDLFSIMDKVTTVYGPMVDNGELTKIFSGMNKYQRRKSSEVKVGNIAIGGDNPIRLQSMTTTSTMDTEGCIAQAQRIIDAGGEFVRLTTQGKREAENLKPISEGLRAKGYSTPLVADVHFNPAVADVAATIVEKVRINPGNYVDPARTFKNLEYSDEEYAAELQKIRDRFVPFLNICKEHHTAIRIGVNHGSLSDRIMSRFGNTPEGMVESCMEFLRVCVEEHFSDVVISIKASNTVVMVQTVRLLVRKMDEENMAFPIHLGVTEAGEGEDGRIKSAVGIGALLGEGIGDTVRVSLSEAPEKEIPVARELVDYAAASAAVRAGARIVDGVLTLRYDDTELEDLQLKAAMDAGAFLIDGKAKELIIEDASFSDAQLKDLSDSILQAARVKFTKTEYISCPGCGRTLYNLEETIAKVKKATSQFKGLKIAIMGCIVNGPGEMADADYGYVGAARGKISLYRGKECVEKNIPESEAVEHLLRLISSK
jgi:1-hydroxy-2-methyl-2-(E)-butenyl 4-diphosphate synthase